METNVLRALININNHPNRDIKELYLGRNRVNTQGDGLEFFVKDAFCHSFDVESIKEKRIEHAKYFSYQGGSSIPPDGVIRNGDAIEVKKMESFKATLQLNSSHPKSKLIRDEVRNRAVLTLEDGNWETKDFMYIFGYIHNEKVQHLHFIYGDCYVADSHVYQNVLNRAKNAIDNEFDSSELAETVEIGRVTKTDALNSSYLRVRPMWGLKHPIEVFEDLSDIKRDDGFLATAILRKVKYDSLSYKDEFEAMIDGNENFSMHVKNIPDPNEPSQAIEVVVIRMNFY